jgi:hypothetical protein
MPVAKLHGEFSPGTIQPPITGHLKNMPSSQKALNEAHLLHAAFLTTIFLFVFVLHLAAIGERPVSLSLVAGIGCAAVADIGVGFMLRKQYMNKAEQALQVEFDAPKALAAWRLANILSFAQAETVTLFGVALKFLGASWKIAGPFFFIGFALLLLWTPRLDLPASSGAPSPPAP